MQTEDGTGGDPKLQVYMFKPEPRTQIPQARPRTPDPTIKSDDRAITSWSRWMIEAMVGFDSDSSSLRTLKCNLGAGNEDWDVQPRSHAFVKTMFWGLGFRF